MNRKSKDNKTKQEEKQFEIGLKQPRKNLFYSWKSSLSLKLKYLETKGYIRNPIPWFLGFISIALIAVQIYWIYISFNSLPSYLPTLLYYRDLSMRITPKIYIYMYPTISSLLLIPTIYFSYRFFYTRKILSLFTIYMIFSFIVLITFILLDLVSIYYA